MTQNITINLSDSARAVVRLATSADKVVYSAYIAEHNVTVDTVGEHVASLADLAVSLYSAKTGLGVDPADKVALKNFKNKVRNGLNTNLGKVVPSKGQSGKYVTAEGLKDESREAFMAKCLAEYDAAHKASK